MMVRLIEQKSDGQDFKMDKKWESLDHISPNLPLAVVTSEDQKFEDHFGFDIAAIEKAGGSVKVTKPVEEPAKG